MTSQKPLRIMVIEDHTVTAIILECLLEDLGHHVAEFAATPLQAERVLRQGASHLDLVILEAVLVGLPSDDLARRLKSLGLPVVVTSSLPEEDLTTLGFDVPYLAQPFSEAEVARIVGGYSGSASVSAA